MIYRKNRKVPRKEDQDVELAPRPSFTDAGFQHSLPEKIKEQRLIVGDKYAILKKLDKVEAKELFDQTGLELDFTPGKHKAEIVGGHKNFGKLKLARNIVTQEFVAVKKVKGEDKVNASQNDGELQSKLSGRPNIMPYLDSVKINADLQLFTSSCPMQGSVMGIFFVHN